MNKLIYLTLTGLLFSGTALSQKKATIHANEQRIESRIFALAKFGKDSLGRGYRVAYTKGDVEARNWYISLLRKSGLDVNIDAAGNIIGKRKGKNASLKPIAFGSHIDMVPHGGDYDGCVGSIAALEVIDVLNENNIVTQHPLEVIIFSNEEGGTIGSMAMAGHLSADGLKNISESGVSMATGIKILGGDPGNIQQAVRKKGDLKAFLELHIEQGGTLEKENIQIGIVEGIVGIEHWEVTVTGMANHAGTTPMQMRQDALLAASRFIIAVNEVTNSHEGKQVGTVGKINAMPGAYNVIPGKVVLGLELRDLSDEKIWQLFKDIEQKAAEISTASGTTISFQHQPTSVKPALTDKTIQDKIVAVTKTLGFTYTHLPSGAGHDAQEISVIAPVGMIFVPSVSGISHSPKEFTKAIDMANGANVLLQTILTIDKDIKLK